MTRKPKLHRSRFPSFGALLVVTLRNGSSTLFAVVGTLAALAIASGDREQSVAVTEQDGDPLSSFFRASDRSQDSWGEIPLLEPIPDRSDPKVIFSFPQPETRKEEEKGNHGKQEKRTEKEGERRKEEEEKRSDRAPRFRLFQWPERTFQTSQTPISRISRQATIEVRSSEQITPEEPLTPPRFVSKNLEPKGPETKTNLSSDAATIPFTIEDVVRLTVANNTEIKNAYLDRIIQQAELATTRSEFYPKVEPILAGRVDGEGTNWNISDGQTRIELGAGIALLMPTGGRLRLNWLSQLRSLSDDQTHEDSLRQGVSLRFTQPLLRDAGVAITKSDLNIAKLQEEINLLNLRDTLIDEITTSIITYRTLLARQEQVNNTRAALENAKKQLEQQQALVEAGREARFRLLRSQQTVTNFESRLIEAQNAVESSRLALLNQLGIDRNIEISAVEDVRQETQEILTLDPETTRQITFANQPNYLAELQQIQISELTVLQAKNDRRWNLDLETQLDEALTRQADFSAGLILRRNLGNRFQDEEAFQRAKVTLLQRQNSLAQLQEIIETEISDRLRDIEVQFQQIQLAQEAVKLAEGELQAQEALVKAGRSDNFQLQQAQQDLLDARNTEIGRRIQYLNTLTELQQTRGTTLEDWNILLETTN